MNPSIDASPPYAKPETIARVSLDEVDGPTDACSVLLTSGRRLDASATEAGDRIEVRSTSGKLVLTVLVTDRGATLELEAADISLASRGDLRLSGRDVHLAASRDLSVEVGGQERRRVALDRHTSVGGRERLEAARVELQASEEDVCVRARDVVRIDGELVALNDDPAPAPFPWSAAASASSP